MSLAFVATLLVIAALLIVIGECRMRDWRRRRQAARAAADIAERSRRECSCGRRLAA